jgi:enediyne biosynthesis protein E4
MKKIIAFIFCITSLVQVFAQGFTEISNAAGITFSREPVYDIGGTVCIFDYDNDGLEDFFLPGGWGTSALYRNNGDGTFSDVLPLIVDAATYALLDSLLITSAIAGDIDNDGDKDLYITTSGFKIHNAVIRQPDVLLENLGGNFVNISAAAGINTISYTESATMGDYNMDGYLDIYVSSYVQNMSYVYDSMGNPIAFLPTCLENFFYINNGNKTFTESAATFGINDAGCGLTAIFSDYDFDNDVDILLANDFGEFNSYPNVLFRNNYPQNSFSSYGNQSGFNRSMFGMGIAPGDYNEDGHMDYYVTNIGSNSLYMNNGDGTFSDQAIALGVDMTWAIQDSLRKTSWACNFFDFDNDTYLDLYVGTGYVAAFMPLTIIMDSSVMFRNDGLGGFEDVSIQTGVAAPISVRGSAIFDFDNDGDMDLVANHSRMQIYNNYGIPQNLLFYRNDNNNSNNWLKIKLTGTRNNRDAYGSRIIVHAGGRIFIREIDGGSSHSSLSSSIAHFGMGNYSTADSVEVHWLGGGIQTLYNIAVNQTLSIVEPVGMAVFAEQNVSNVTLFPNPVRNLNELNIRINALKETSITFVLEDILGRQIAKTEKNIFEETNILNASNLFPNLNLENQIYLLRLYNANVNIFNEKLHIRN